MEPGRFLRTSRLPSEFFSTAESSPDQSLCHDHSVRLQLHQISGYDLGSYHRQARLYRYF